MIDVFSGGLVYEFTQEPNNYGLVDVSSTGDIQLRKDFILLQAQFGSLPKINLNHVANSMKKNAKQYQISLKKQTYGLPSCDSKVYDNIDVSDGVPSSMAKDIISVGVTVQKGQYVELTNEQMTSKYKVTNPNGGAYQGSNRLEKVIDIMTGTDIVRKGNGSNCMYNECSDGSSGDDFDEDTSSGESDDEAFGVFARVATFFKQLLRIFSKARVQEDNST